MYKATGKTVNEVLSNRVFKPLNWKNTGWVTEGNNNLVCDINTSLGYPTLRFGSNVGDERNLYINARELALWGNSHLNKGVMESQQILSKQFFDITTSIQSPNVLPDTIPKFGFNWGIKDSKTSVDYYELGSDLPDESYQILGASGCSCTVIPEHNAIAVRMYNSLNSSENLEFDYVKDIQTFGKMIFSALSK